MINPNRTCKEDTQAASGNASPVCYANSSELRPEYTEEVCEITIIDGLEQEKMLNCTPRSYRNLMELVVNELWEEWDDCKGKAMCGTCHAEVVDGEIVKLDSFE